MQHRLELAGQQFGRWTVKDRAGRGHRGAILWNCICSCGTEKRVIANSLRQGLSKSCGCIQKTGKTWTIEQHRASKKKYKQSIPGYRAMELKRWREADPERKRLYKRQTNYRTKYGLELKDVEQIFFSQNNKCAICKKTIVLGGRSGAKVDHDHKTGKVRGILCSVCNTALGSFRDDTDILASAITYLNKHNAELS